MFELFQKIFIGHSHKWETRKVRQLFYESDDKMSIGESYTCRCNICGKIKQYTINY